MLLCHNILTVLVYSSHAYFVGLWSRMMAFGLRPRGQWPIATGHAGTSWLPHDASAASA